MGWSSDEKEVVNKEGMQTSSKILLGILIFLALPLYFVKMMSPSVENVESTNLYSKSSIENV